MPLHVALLVVPKIMYALDLWFTPSYWDGSNNLQHGSIGVAKKLASVQCIIAIAITGAMRTTASNLLEVHANLLPTSLLLQNTCHRAIVHLITHPKTHPLYTLV
ncbi:hypothetical protein BDR04DRAFT_1025367 [Suillus decipiens]|nr:hypothetical protein BDR04DRAFT_1025367 [Suillus decipiens]